MSAKRVLPIYHIAIALCSLSLTVWSTSYAQQPDAASKTTDEAPTKDVNADCPCSKKRQKLLDIIELAKESDASPTKMYRLDPKKFTISEEWIAEALRCDCTIKKKGAPVSKAARNIPVLTPAEVNKDCKVLLELEYQLIKELDFQAGVTLLRNFAAQMGADAVAITEYNKKRSVHGQMLQCNAPNARTFGDMDFKVFNDYIFDPRTGLSWQRCSLGQETRPDKCEGQARATDINAAKNYCASLTPIANRRWRLPENEELFSLVSNKNARESKKANINARYFPNTPPEVYWSNTPYWSDKAMSNVDFESGDQIAYDRQKSGYTRCVIDLIPQK